MVKGERLGKVGIVIVRTKKRHGVSSEVAAHTSTRPWCAGHHFPKAVYLPRLIYSMKLLCVQLSVLVFAQWV